MARRLLLHRLMATKTNKRQEQKLHDAVSHAASCLKEAGEPLYGLGPSLHYADAFERYSKAMKDLVAYVCPLNVADWSWDGYEGSFHFWWDFGAPLAQPGTEHDYDTRFVQMRCATRLDPQKPLSEELARLRAEAAHYDELRSMALRWATVTHRASKPAEGAAS